MTCELSTSLLEPAADCWPTSSLDMSPSRLSSGILTPARSCETEPQTDGSPSSKSLKEMCDPSISASGPDEWIASQRASLVRIFQAQERAPGSTASEADSTARPSGQLTMFNLDSSGWRIVQKFGPEGVTVSLPILWRADMPGATAYLPHLMSAQGISVSVGGASLPTLTVCGNYNRKGASPTSGDGIATALKNLPTLNARDYKGLPGAGCIARGGRKSSLPVAMKKLPTLCATDWKGAYSAEGYAKQMQMRSKPLRDTPVHSTGHRLTSAFAEWWMGWPLGWTALNAPATAKSRSKRRQHGSH